MTVYYRVFDLNEKDPSEIVFEGSAEFRPVVGDEIYNEKTNATYVVQKCGMVHMDMTRGYLSIRHLELKCVRRRVPGE